MDLSTIGSVSQYARNAALKTQWELKKKNGGVTGHSRSLNDLLSVDGSASRTQQEADDEKLQKITAKVSAGAKLTEKEMEYLRERNPQLYEKLRQIEREQKAYEEALRRCKSKDEAQRLHTARVGEIMESAKSGDGMAAYRLNRMTESMTAFTETEGYQSLPTEAEQSAERQELREAAQPAPEPEASVAAEQEPERVERRETAEAAASAAKEAQPAPDDAPKAADERPAAAMRFGAQAYVSRQEEETPESSRHRALDVDA